MTVSVTLCELCLSSSCERLKGKDCEFERVLLLVKHLLWSDRPEPDLRGLISLDNKTKRINVLIVADGAGILGKCVKLVLTSRLHSSPPHCDLLFLSLCCTLHPRHFTPHSSLIHPIIPPVTPVYCVFLHPFICTGKNERGLKRRNQATKKTTKKGGDLINDNDQISEIIVDMCIICYISHI